LRKKNLCGGSLTFRCPARTLPGASGGRGLSPVAHTPYRIRGRRPGARGARSGPSWSCRQRVSAGSAGSGGVDRGATVTLALRQLGVTLGMRRSAWRLWRCHRESIPTRRRSPPLPRRTLWVVWQLWQLPQHCSRQLHFFANDLRSVRHICHQWEHHRHRDAQQTENVGHQRIPARCKFHVRIPRDTASVAPMSGAEPGGRRWIRIVWISGTSYPGRVRSRLFP
jgi:hypothetical protein